MDLLPNFVGETNSSSGAAKPFREKTERPQVIANRARVELHTFVTAPQNPIRDSGYLTDAGLTALVLMRQEQSRFNLDCVN